MKESEESQCPTTGVYGLSGDTVEGMKDGVASFEIPTNSMKRHTKLRAKMMSARQL